MEEGRRFVDLDDLIERRERYLAAEIENGFKLDDVLAGLYSDPFHFIFELLQNAEDAGATCVRFELDENRLVFIHNGREFDLDDIVAVTGIGNTTKSNDLTQIGKFGIGFKSVFAITKSPAILSGEFRIEINNFVVPSIYKGVDLLDVQSGETMIILPFNHPQRDKDEIFVDVAEKLANLDIQSLVFLRKIESLKWETPEADGEYRRERKPDDDFDLLSRVTIESDGVVETYLVFEDSVQVDGYDHKVSVGYLVESDDEKNERIVPVKEAKLFAFFPTNQKTNLNFLIQGPFRTTPARDNIPLSDAKNQVLLDGLADLVVKSLPVLKAKGFLDAGFLGILPTVLGQKNYEIYELFYSRVKQCFMSGEALLPTNSGEFAAYDDVVLSGSREVVDLLEQGDLKDLFGCMHWLPIEITEARTNALWQYLNKELKIEEVDFDRFVRKLNDAFLSKKGNEWYIAFYRRLTDQRSVWSGSSYRPLLSLPFLRLESGGNLKLNDRKGQIQVYLPTEKDTGYKTVHREIVADEVALAFLKDLGLTKPGLYAEVKDVILLEYEGEQPEFDLKVYETDMNKILSVYEDVSEHKRADLAGRVAELRIILGRNPKTDDERLLKGSELYFGDDDLARYFEPVEGVYFVSDFFGERERSFLAAVGVRALPRRISFDPKFDEETKRVIRRNTNCTNDIALVDVQLYGLQENLGTKIDKDRSMLIWRILDQIYEIKGASYFQGVYLWKHRKPKQEYFEAAFLKELRGVKWLFTKDGECVTGDSIRMSELDEGYGGSESFRRFMKGSLGFKDDVFDLLPEKYSRTLELTRDIPLEELEKFVQHYHETQRGDDGGWEPEKGPEAVPGVVKPYVPRERKPGKKPKMPVFGGDDEGVPGDDDVPGSGDADGNRADEKDRKKIGDWSEAFVMSYLRKRFGKMGEVVDTDAGFKVENEDGDQFEIIWLNAGKNRGEGCDFQIERNGEVKEYIEVKGHVTEKENFIPLSGAQLEFARKLHEAGKGDLYFVYLVTNAGGNNGDPVLTTLQDPVQLWVDGKIVAHPVNLFI